MRLDRSGKPASSASRALTTAYDFGAGLCPGVAAPATRSVGNNDIYLEIDNTQFNSGGVDVEATFTGNGRGYDAFVGADAVGNSVTGYACSTCEGQLAATNNQTNTGDVSAIANTTDRSLGPRRDHRLQRHRQRRQLLCDPSGQ